MRRARVIAVALTLLAASACSNGDDNAQDAAGATEAACAAFLAGNDKALEAVAARGLPGLAPNPSAAKLLNFVELNCDRHPATKLRRRVAAPEDVAVPGVRLCDTLPLPPVEKDPKTGITIFGDLTEADPYAGRMLAVMWNPASGENHRGDGAATPVKVGDYDAVAAPITVFQQTVLPELGTVIAWSDGKTNFGLYGRGWSLAERDELVRMAASAFPVDGGYAVEFLPDGFGRVFNGNAIALSLFMITANSLYLEQFRGDTGLLDLAGLDMTAEAYQAFRFFAPDVEARRVGSRDALVGRAWHADGPAVVTWREPDGLVVRIVGIGVPLDTALAVASVTRELADGEWISVVEHDVDCSAAPAS